MADVNNSTAGVIGRGLFIKGELNGEEDLIIDDERGYLKHAQAA